MAVQIRKLIEILTKLQSNIECSFFCTTFLLFLAHGVLMYYKTFLSASADTGMLSPVWYTMLGDNVCTGCAQKLDLFVTLLHYDVERCSIHQMFSIFWSRLTQNAFLCHHVLYRPYKLLNVVRFY